MVDVLEMCLQASPGFNGFFHDGVEASVNWLVSYIHIGVGFEVAYLYWNGKFEGQEREISNEYESHAFFVSVGCRVS